MQPPAKLEVSAKLEASTKKKAAPPPPPPPALKQEARDDVTAQMSPFDPPPPPPSDLLTGASISPPIPRQSMSGSLPRPQPAVRASTPAASPDASFAPPTVYAPTPAALSAVVDVAVPAVLVLYALRAIWLLMRAGSPVAGSLSWLVAAIAYAGRAERLHHAPDRRGTGGSALAALTSALLFLISLAR